MDHTKLRGVKKIRHKRTDTLSFSSCKIQRQAKLISDVTSQDSDELWAAPLGQKARRKLLERLLFHFLIWVLVTLWKFMECALNNLRDVLYVFTEIDCTSIQNYKFITKWINVFIINPWDYMLCRVPFISVVSFSNSLRGPHHSKIRTSQISSSSSDPSPPLRRPFF